MWNLGRHQLLDIYDLLRANDAKKLWGSTYFQRVDEKPGGT